ncbi:methyltransferase domain-containing protein [Micromonospora sp. B11E3]|uniref:methyltransferase domain-containing protein n=1 Tax=Micromonospora sp. B11E3 TaxID=3153562 RepID=UPI00325E670C
MDEIERVIHGFVAEVLLEGEDISFDERTPLLEHRLIDSLNVEELIAFVESEYSITLSDWPHSKWETIESMAGLVRTHSLRSPEAAVPKTDVTPDAIATDYEKSVARYWNEKLNDPINLLLGAEDGLVHHHYGLGEYDPAVLSGSGADREAAIIRELHRLECAQMDVVLDAFGGMGPDERLLDAGSGRGGGSFSAHRRFGCWVDGITLSQYQVDFATKQAARHGCTDKVAFHLQNMTRTLFPDGHFDRVLTNETTMYVDLAAAFGEFARLLRPGGRYVCVTYCVNDAIAPTSADCEAVDAHYGTRMHKRSEYLAALSAAGFSPSQVTVLNSETIPYWELRSHSEHRTGVEQAFLDGYRSNVLQYVLIAADRLPA